jgi:hypothetical protein
MSSMKKIGEMQFTRRISKASFRSVTNRQTVRQGCDATGFPDLGPDYTSAVDVLQAQGMDVARIERFYPHALRYPPDRIFATITALKNVQVDHVKILNRDPLLWYSDPQCWEARLDVLRELGVDAGKIVAMFPGVLRLPPETLQAKFAALSRMGLVAAKVVRHCPTALNLTEDRIRTTIAFLDSVGLDGLRVVNGYPMVLSRSLASKLRPAVHFVTVEMGRDVIELQRCPACFTLSLDRRLRPRYLFATLHSMSHFKIGTFFLCTDSLFAYRVGRPLDEYHTWLSQYISKLESE